MAVYGGFFGAGIGILMISALNFLELEDMRHVVALKNLLTGCLRGVAVAVLVLEGVVNWSYGVPMALGGLVGGYLGGTLSGRANPTVLRWLVIGIGFSVTAYYFWTLYGLPEPRIGGEEFDVGQAGGYAQDTVDYERDPPAVGSVPLLDRRGQRALVVGNGL